MRVFCSLYNYRGNRSFKVILVYGNINNDKFVPCTSGCTTRERILHSLIQKNQISKQDAMLRVVIRIIFQNCPGMLSSFCQIFSNVLNIFFNEVNNNMLI